VNRFRLPIAAATVALIANILIGSGIAQAATTAGSKCTKLGQVVTSGGKKLTCSLIWTTTPVKAAPTKAASKSNLLQDKSFRLESVSFNTDLGTAGAEARITNISRSSKSASLGITILGTDGKTVLVNMVGSALQVSPGQTVTVTFVSMSGDLPSGNFKYAFQVTAEF
jgi:hypothetical protein